MWPSLLGSDRTRCVDVDLIDFFCQCQAETSARITGALRGSELDGIIIDELETALYRESKARIAVVAAGAGWQALGEARCQPTEEEVRLHEHLVREWQRAAQVVAELFERPLR